MKYGGLVQRITCAYLPLLLLAPCAPTTTQAQVSSSTSGRAQSELPIFADLKSYADFGPAAAADGVRHCLQRYNIEQRKFNHHLDSTPSTWAGQLLVNETARVVSGPLIPKCGSTTLRLMFMDQALRATVSPARNNFSLGHTLRDFSQVYPPRPLLPDGHHAGDVEYAQGLLERLRASGATDTRVHFAVVRNPVDHLLGVYKQIAFRYPLKIRTADGRQQLMFLKHPESARRYCNATLEERERHFVDFLRRVGVYDTTAAALSPDWSQASTPHVHQELARGVDGYNEHMPPQLYWLQDYKVSKRRAARGQAESAEVRVMRNVDYLIRLERWDEDFAEIQAQTPWVAQWLAERRGPEGAREPITYRNHFNIDDNVTTTWTDICQDARQMRALEASGWKTAIMALTHHFGVLFFSRHAPHICQFLAYDFACFRYPMPAVCVDYALVRAQPISPKE